jgi:nucleoside-diphosphate-sugar epimerase
MPNTKYFITGATGLVGSYIARKLVGEGKEVYALKRKNSKSSDNKTLVTKEIEHKINWIEGDILDVSLLLEVLQGMDYVIHSAAAVSMLPKDQAQTFKVNIEGTANMVNAALEAKVRKFCHISSIAAIGVPENVVSINEKANWADDNKNFIYAKSKHYAEREVWRGIAEGLNAVIVNPSTVLGISPPDRSSGQIIHLIAKGISYYPLGNINLIDAEDVAEVIFRLLHSEIQSERFILNAGNISYKDFFTKVGNHFGKPAPKYKLGTRALQIVFLLSKITHFWGLSKTQMSREIISATQSTHTYDNTKIINTLGNFQFKDLVQTIREVCKRN